MRTTLNLDNEWVRQAQESSGIQEKTALIHEALRLVIARGAGRRLAELGGAMPELRIATRRRNPKRRKP